MKVYHLFTTSLALACFGTVVYAGVKQPRSMRAVNMRFSHSLICFSAKKKDGPQPATRLKKWW